MLSSNPRLKHRAFARSYLLRLISILKVGFSGIDVHKAHVVMHDSTTCICQQKLFSILSVTSQQEYFKIKMLIDLSTYNYMLFRAICRYGPSRPMHPLSFTPLRCLLLVTSL